MWSLKELRHGLRNLKSLAFSFQIRRLQSGLIFSILCHPCCFIVCHYHFDVFLLLNSYFQVSFTLKVILYVGKITQNTVTELLLAWVAFLCSCVENTRCFFKHEACIKRIVPPHWLLIKLALSRTEKRLSKEENNSQDDCVLTILLTAFLFRMKTLSSMLPPQDLWCQRLL